MKTLKFIGLAIAVILLGVNFTSCSKEEEPKYNLITGEKKLTKIGKTDSDGSEIRTFTYDSEERLFEVSYADDDDTYSQSYVWKNNEIETTNGGWPYILSNGVISRYNDLWELKYDNEQRLSEIESSDIYHDKYIIDWNSNGGLFNIASYSSNDISNPANKVRQNSMRFFYNQEDRISCKGFNPIAPFFIDCGFCAEDLWIAHPELVGARTNMLPNTFERISTYWDNDGRVQFYTEQGNFSYKFDDDGYIVECIVIDPSFGEIKYTMVWE